MIKPSNNTVPELKFHRNDGAIEIGEGLGKLNWISSPEEESIATIQVISTGTHTTTNFPHEMVINTNNLRVQSSITASGALSASGFIYGLLPPQTRPQPIVVYHNNKDVPENKGRLETSSLRVFNNIIASTNGSLVIGTNITDGGTTGPTNPTLPPDDPSDPIIFNPDGPVIFNNAITKHRGILNISGSGKLITSGGITIKPGTLAENNSIRDPLLSYNTSTGNIQLAKNTFDGVNDTEFGGNAQIKGNLSFSGS